MLMWVLQALFQAHEGAERRPHQTCILDKFAIREVRSRCGLKSRILVLNSHSDILAELDIPPSGIQEVQDVVPYPRGTMTPGGYLPGAAQPPEILLYYSAQLYLRKLLNDIQKELYQESKLAAA